mgnify:CR=1 FL=1
MVFIARENRNDLERRNDHFARFRAKAQIKGESLEDKPFLHFESPTDMDFMKKFYKIWSKNEGWSDYEQTINFVFTHKKLDAIKEHKKSIKKLTVSTLVDLDHDFIEDKWYYNLKRLHSTKYACTLFTMQFLDGNRGIDKEIIIRVIQEISGVLEVEYIVKEAVDGTLKRLNKMNKKIIEDLNSVKVNSPLNDHELAEAITRASGVSEDSESFNWEVRKIEEKLRAHALQDSNGLVRTLLNRMLEDLSPVLKKKPTSN